MTGRCAVRACFQPTPLARVPSSMSAIGVRLHAGSLRSTSMDALCISGGVHVEAVAALFRQTELLCLIRFWRSAGECSDRVAMADSVRGLKRYKVDISGHRGHLFRGSVGAYAGLRFLHAVFWRCGACSDSLGFAVCHTSASMLVLLVMSASSRHADCIPRRVVAVGCFT